MKINKLFLIVISILLLALAGGAKALSVGQSFSFNIESEYDSNGREEISAALIKIGTKIYFYADQDWWYNLEYFQQNETRKKLGELEEEFIRTIYPQLTSFYGSEWKPGIDNDEKLIILIHPMKEGAGSYFRTADEYPKLQIPESNEKEMIYLNSDYLSSPYLKIFLSHEFTHLITFNQKDKKQEVEEDTWLNEARAEYSAALLGYDNNFEESNIKSRLKSFLTSPSDSLTEWQNKPEDYGVANIFIQYLVDHYGKEILAESLNSEKVGIASLNYALEKKGFKENFSQIFTDWTIAVVINNCSVNSKYCYNNQHLRNFRITPSVNFLPLEGESTLAATKTTKDWSGNWYKFVGGQGSLKIEFTGNSNNVFKIPYIAHDLSGNQSLGFLELSENNRAEIIISDFGTKIISVIIIPSIQTKTSDFSDKEEPVAFFWSASTTRTEEVLPKYLDKPISQMSKQEILTKISEIEDILKKLKEQLNKTINPNPVPLSCRIFNNNLFYGMTNNSEVSCLQKFLKDQGLEIYPEGLITGNFLGLTKIAVIRFQEKYAAEILFPLGLEAGTGFIGSATRVKINEMLGY